MKHWKHLTAVLGAAALGIALAGCGGDGSSGGGSKKLSGIVQSVLSDAVQANRPFIVNDLEKTGVEEKIAEGMSDSNGNYSVEIEDGKFIYIVFPPTQAGGEPRSSGLADLDDGDVQKTLSDSTDIACQAGVTAVRDGTLRAEQMDATRIANLEAGASDVLNTTMVNFNDPAAVAMAATRVRIITNDGANPPPARPL